MADHEIFGFLYFKGGLPAETGLLSCCGEKPRTYKMGGPIPGGDAIIWCNLSADGMRAAGLSQEPRLKHAYYLGIPPEDFLEEFGPWWRKEDDEFFCQRVASAFCRLMRLASALVADISGEDGRPRLLSSATLSEYLLSVMTGQSYPESGYQQILAQRRRGPIFSRGHFTREPQDIALLLRRPRSSHARAMLGARVPIDVLPGGIRPHPVERMSELLAIGGPVLGSVIIRGLAKNISPVYGYGHISYVRQEARRHWLCGEELAAMADFADIEEIGRAHV